jgi:hypothetical protein
LPQGDVEKRINSGQSSADHQRAHAAAEEKSAIPRDQQSGGDGRNQISQAEADEFRD